MENILEKRKVLMNSEIEILTIDIPKKKKSHKKIIISLFALIVVFISSFAFLLYGPWNTFRNWLITTAMTTMSIKSKLC